MGNPETSPRVPLELQKVFIESQKGVVFDQAPKCAAKEFKRSFSVRQFGRKLFPGKGSNHSRGSSKSRKSTKSSTPTDQSVELFSIPTDILITTPPVQSNQSTPQEFLDKLLSSRGYSIERFRGLDSGYCRKPTRLQIASYGSAVKDALQNSYAGYLRRLLKAGLSPDPCSASGDYFVHRVIRFGDVEVLRVLLGEGASVQVVDSLGRSPLHDACGGTGPTCFDLVGLIIEKDPDLLFLEDSSGMLPLQYITCPEDSKRWVDFLDSKKDVWWKPNQRGRSNFLKTQPPESLQLKDPLHALPRRLAKKVGSGDLDPDEAVYLAIMIEECRDTPHEKVHEDDSDCDMMENALGSGW